jgi:hypothetical protein
VRDYRAKVTAGIDNNCYASWNDCSADARDISGRLSCVTDADGIRLAGNTGGEDIDIEFARREILARKRAHADVALAGCVPERKKTKGGIINAGCVASERLSADGRVLEAVDVAIERAITHGRV